MPGRVETTHEPDLEPLAAESAVAAALGPSSVAERVLSLQRSTGNRGVNRVLARRGGSAPPALPGTLLGGVSETQRKQLTFVTDTIPTLDIHTLQSTDAEIAAYQAHTGPGTQQLTAPSGTEYAASIPTSLRGALGAVASHLINSVSFTHGSTSSPGLPENSTVALQLDLTVYGGGPGVYRFSRINAGGTQRVLIDVVGTPATGLAAAPATGGKFDAHHFAWGSSDAAFQALVRQAVETFPDSMLSLIDGLRFTTRPPDPSEADEGGHYDPVTHTVFIFPLGMTATMGRFGDPGGAVATNAVRTVIHEIAHAIDDVPVRRAIAAEESATSALNTWVSEHGTTFPASLQATYDRLDAAVTAAQRARAGARGLSGSTEQEQDDPGASNAFTEALAADAAAAITPYTPTRAAEHAERLETFAEAYSLFLTEPQTLRALRPRLFAYFTDLQSGAISSSTGRRARGR